MEKEKLHLFLSVTLAIVIGAGLTATQFPAAGNDDSHITYWAAHAFAEYGSIVNYNGEHVEQSSSLAFVLLLALIKTVTGVEPPTAGWFASCLFSISCVFSVARLAARMAPRSAIWAPLFLMTWVPMLYWSTSGMEMTLAAFLGCTIADAGGNLIDHAGRIPQQGWLIVVPAMIGFALVRPETPIVLACMFVFAVIVHAVTWYRAPSVDAKVRLLRAVGLAGVGLLIAATLALFRQAAFGSIVPNSAAAKVGGFALSGGVTYLEKGISMSGTFLALAGLGGIVTIGRDIVRSRASSSALLVAGFGAACIAFVVSSGGDWMPGARLLVPFAPVVAVLAAVAVGWATERHLIVGVVVGAGLVALDIRNVLAFGESRSNGSYSGNAAFDGARVLIGPAFPPFVFSELGNKAHRRDARLLGVLLDVVARLRPTAERPVYLMSGQAGMVPYYVFREHYGKARFIDLFGITDRDIVACIPSSELRLQVHGIRIGSSYVIEHADRMDPKCGARRPDIVFSTGRFPGELRKLGYVRIYQGPRDMDAFIALDKDQALRLGIAESRSRAE